MFTDADLDNVPFSPDSIFNRGAVSNRPLLLVEPSYKINGEEKTNKNQAQARSARANGEEDNNKPTSKSTPDHVTDAKGETTLSNDSKSKAAPSTDKADSEVGPVPKAETKEDPKAAAKSSTDQKLSSSKKPALNADTKPIEESSPKSQNVGQETTAAASSDLGSKRSENVSSTSHMKQDVRQSVSKPSIEENIVLGVALEGSKRTLPIEEEMTPPSNQEDMKELATLRSGNSPGVAEKKNDMKRSKSNGSPGNDQVDQQD